MKKTPLVLLSFLLPYFMFSQLNGMYTIGVTASDYSTIGDAITELETVGVSGAVTFNLKDGTYNEQGLNISTIPGVSSTNTITFQSENLNAENVIIDGNNIITIENDAKHITFNHLKFYTYASSSSTSSRSAFRIYSDFITISNCIFAGGRSVSSEYFFDSYIALLRNSYIIVSANNISITNNQFSSIGAAISSSYCDNLSITNNTFAGGVVVSINLNNINNLEINGNNFQGAIKYKPIQGSSLSGETKIKNNLIHSSNTELEYGPSLTLSGTGDNANITIANNFIATKNGISVRSFNTSKVINNSFHVDQDHCITFYNDNRLESFDLYNNVFYSNLETPSLKIFQSFDLSKLNSNNNAFSKQKEVIFHCSSGTYGTYYDLTDWMTFSGKETTSIITDIVYNSDSDLHTPNALMLDGTGLSISADLDLDIDNENRNLSSPDIGADEFDINYDSFLDLEIVDIISPTNTGCEDSGIILSIKNNCTIIINSFDIECSLNGFRDNISNYITTINPNETINISLDNCQIVKNTFYDKLDFYVSNPNGLLDNNYSNNIKSITNIFQLGDFNITVENNECIGSFDLSIPLISDTTVNWSTNETANAISVNSIGEYSVTVTDAQGCQITKSITLN